MERERESDWCVANNCHFQAYLGGDGFGKHNFWVQLSSNQQPLPLTYISVSKQLLHRTPLPVAMKKMCSIRWFKKCTWWMLAMLGDRVTIAWVC